MLPISAAETKKGISVVIPPSLSYALREEKAVIDGYVDGIESVKQAIYKALMTERYTYEIYSQNYGAEFNDIIGKGKSYAKSVLEERIKDALKPDDRIKNVYDFVYRDIDKESLEATFTVATIFGKAEIRKKVKI